MRFIREDILHAERAVATTLSGALNAGSTVLWLVSGGSNIASEVRVMAKLNATGVPLERLHILPVDERYGPYDHADSNMAALRRAGFENGAATIYDVLSHTLGPAETAHEYGTLAEALFRKCDVIVAQLGLGGDGHTAGILPHSPALTEVSSAAFAYEWTDYSRLTLTIPMLQKCSACFVLAYGDAKKTALEKLAAHYGDVADTPALALWEAAHVTVYNEYIETEE